MANYIDGFVFPIPQDCLNDYRAVAVKIAEIWKEHGAMGYFEYIGEDLEFDGTRSFLECIDVKENESLIFGWTVFESRNARDIANERVASDPRMQELIAPITNPERMIFNAGRMAFGGFKKFIS